MLRHELTSTRLSSHAGGKVRVTSLERTLADVLVCPDPGSGWEEFQLPLITHGRRQDLFSVTSGFGVD
jgi:hypothetical protein